MVIGVAAVVATVLTPRGRCEDDPNFSPDDLDSLEETLDILRDPELVASLEQSRIEAARGESLPLPLD